MNKILKLTIVLFLVCAVVAGVLGVVNELTYETIEEQTKQSLANAAAILEEAGYSFADVVKTTVLLTDIKDFAAMNAVYAEHFSGAYPARVCYQVAALPMGAKVEIDMIAGK